MIDLVEKVAENVKEILYTLRRDIPDFDHFAGGSRRFGYYTKNSDADFFVYASSKNKEKILSTLENIGFVYNGANSYTSELSMMYTFKGIINIGIYNDKRQFNEEKERNDIVARYLTENLEIIKLLQLIKYNSIRGAKNNFQYSGTELFNLIYKLAKEF